jgi:hypothetical protein
MDLSGLGRVGNTSLAVEYLHHHADYPDDVFGLRGPARDDALRRLR